MRLPSSWIVLERIGFPDRAHLELLASLHDQARVPMCFVGDLDPLDLSTFLAMRALAHDFVDRRPALPLSWVGIADPWIRLCRRWLEAGRSLPLLPMVPLEREHWNVLRRVAPELPATLGPASAHILDSGQKLDIAGAAGGFYRRAFPIHLFEHLKRAVHRAPGE